MQTMSTQPIAITYIHRGANHLKVSSKPIDAERMTLCWYRGFYQTIYINTRLQLAQEAQ
jgi:hypothetical protein